MVRFGGGGELDDIGAWAATGPGPEKCVPYMQLRVSGSSPGQPTVQVQLKPYSSRVAALTVAGVRVNSSRFCVQIFGGYSGRKAVCGPLTGNHAPFLIQRNQERQFRSCCSEVVSCFYWPGPVMLRPVPPGQGCGNSTTPQPRARWPKLSGCPVPEIRREAQQQHLGVFALSGQFCSGGSVLTAVRRVTALPPAAGRSNEARGPVRCFEERTAGAG